MSGIIFEMFCKTLNSGKKYSVKISLRVINNIIHCCICVSERYHLWLLKINTFHLIIIEIRCIVIVCMEIQELYLYTVNMSCMITTSENIEMGILGIHSISILKIYCGNDRLIVDYIALFPCFGNMGMNFRNSIQY